VRYETHGNTIKGIEPMVDGQPVTEFAAHISDRLNCFVEDVIVHASQTEMPEGISISEIPVAERPPEIVERFQSALVGGGMPIWKILYHDSKFEDH
jgi:hypothetical protein